MNSLCFSLGDKIVVYNWRRSKILILRFLSISCPCTSLIYLSLIFLRVNIKHLLFYVPFLIFLAISLLIISRRRIFSPVYLIFIKMAGFIIACSMRSHSGGWREMESGRKKAEAEERKREKEGSAFEICVQKLFPPTLSARNSNLRFWSTVLASTPLLCFFLLTCRCWCCCCCCRELKHLRRRQRRQFQKTIDLMIKTTALHLHHAF